jgi:hypothetical protein
MKRMLPKTQIDAEGFNTRETPSIHPPQRWSHARLVSPYGGSVMHASAIDDGMCFINSRQSPKWHLLIQSFTLASLI